MSKHAHAQHGFTVIELVLITVIVCVLGALVALTASGVQANNRNDNRQSDINNLRGQLEAYYAETDTYPTFADLHSPTWRAKNMPKLSSGWVDDPRWSPHVAGCTIDGQATVSSKPEPNCYSYQVVSSDGAACDDEKTLCVHYTLTATLEGGGKYVKSSLN